MHKRSRSTPGSVVKGTLLCVTHTGRRRNRGLFNILADRRSVGVVPDMVGGVAAALFRLAAAHPPPEPEKEQDEKDAAADSAADDRPRRIRAPCRRL